MPLLSLSAYATTHGTSRQAATAWRARGVLVLSDGQVDVGPSDQRMQQLGLGRFNSGAGHGGRRQPSTASTTPGPGQRSTAGHHVGLSGAATVRARIDNAAEALTAAKRSLGDLAKLTDDASSRYHDRLCEAAGWVDWAETVAGPIARDLGLLDRTADLLHSLERHVVTRLITLGHDADEVQNPALERR